MEIVCCVCWNLPYSVLLMRSLITPSTSSPPQPCYSSLKFWMTPVFHFLYYPGFSRALLEKARKLCKFGPPIIQIFLFHLVAYHFLEITDYITHCSEQFTTLPSQNPMFTNLNFSDSLFLCCLSFFINHQSLIFSII